MNIHDTLKAIRELAADVPLDAESLGDDMHEAEYILATCEPRLSTAAYHHSMSMFLGLRARALKARDIHEAEYVRMSRAASTAAYNQEV